MEAKTNKKSKKPRSANVHKSVQESSKLSTLHRKQTEVARVHDIKCNMLIQGKLSYLEYMELRDEIIRLKVLKDTLARRAAELEEL